MKYTSTKLILVCLLEEAVSGAVVLRQLLETVLIINHQLYYKFAIFPHFSLSFGSLCPFSLSVARTIEHC